MFILDGKSLPLDVPFSHNEINYPANWLRLSTPEEREELGITEVPDEPQYDQRFAWGFAEDGSLIWKDHVQLQDQWISQVKQTAGSLLSQTDWYITRQAENGTNVPQEVLTRRAEIRSLSNEKELALLSTTTSEELANYVTSPEFSAWEVAVVADETESIIE